MKVIYQSEMTECGLACAAMISSHYGREVSVISLREKGFASNKGHSLLHIKKVFDFIGFETRALKIHAKKIQQSNLPCILHWNGNHYVVCEKISKKNVTIIDPAKGRQRIGLETFEKCYTGYAIEIHESHKITNEELNKSSTFFEVIKTPSNISSSIWKIIFTTLLLQLYLIATPYYTKLTIDYVMSGSAQNVFHLLFGVFTALLIAQVTVNYLRDYMVIKLSSEVAQKTYFGLFAHLITLPLGFFSRRSTGDLVSRFNSVDAIRNILSKGVIESVLDGFIALVVIGILGYYNILLSVVTVITITLFSIINHIYSIKQREHTESSVYSEAIERTYFTEVVGNIASIKVFGNEEQIRERWYSLFLNKLQESDSAKLVGLLRDSFKNFLFGFDLIVSLYLISIQYGFETESVGNIIAIVFLKVQLLQRQDSLAKNMSQIYLIALHSDRIGDVVSTESENILNCTDSELRSKNIEAINISHRYSQFDQPTFSNISLSIDSGESVALTGPSGCGKTTLLKCLMGLESINEGKITSGHRSIYGSMNYRGRIASVFQNDKLIAGTIFDNIFFNQGKRDIRLVQSAAQVAAIHNDIIAMPMQYETLVSDLGSNLSGGQVQRILIARALYSSPDILFMDEATSNLDHDTELEVIANIKNLDITRVFTAHRKSTIESADRVINITNV